MEFQEVVGALQMISGDFKAVIGYFRRYFIGLQGFSMGLQRHSRDIPGVFRAFRLCSKGCRALQDCFSGSHEVSGVSGSQQGV